MIGNKEQGGSMKTLKTLKTLKVVAFSAMALLMLTLPALALGQPAAATPAASAPSFSQWDLGTYVGLSAAVVGVVGLLKMLFPAWIEGKEPHLGLAFSYILGISTKLFVPGMYKDVNWVIFLLSLLAVAAGAKFGHDHLLNEIIKGGSEGAAPEKPAAPAAPVEVKK